MDVVFLFLLFLQLLLEPSLAGPRHAHHQAECVAPLKLNYPALLQSDGVWRHRCRFMTRLCLDQGSYILYDKDLIRGSPNGEYLPRLDLHDVRWFHRHPDIGAHGPEKTVFGVNLPFRNPVTRFPTDRQDLQLYTANVTMHVILPPAPPPTPNPRP